MISPAIGDLSGDFMALRKRFSFGGCTCESMRLLLNDDRMTATPIAGSAPMYMLPPRLIEGP